MKYLGVDYGTKKVGLALSDESGSIATPYEVVPNNDQLMRRLQDICKKEQVEKIVVGASTDYYGNDNPVMPEIRAFSDTCERILKLPVEGEPEFLTTSQAVRTSQNIEHVDAAAAALILQSFLDRNGA
jgi:putative Holliday junction resolvase